VELKGRVREMAEKLVAMLSSYLGRKPSLEEVVELALERLLQEFEGRYELVWY
jgi:hypothetical protein